MGQETQITDKSYDRIYLTKYKQELEKHNINTDVETFLNSAFYEKVERSIQEAQNDG